MMTPLGLSAHVLTVMVPGMNALVGHKQISLLAFKDILTLVLTTKQKCNLHQTWALTTVRACSFQAKKRKSGRLTEVTE